MQTIGCDTQSLGAESSVERRCGVDAAGRDFKPLAEGGVLLFVTRGILFAEFGASFDAEETPTS